MILLPKKPSVKLKGFNEQDGYLLSPPRRMQYDRNFFPGGAKKSPSVKLAASMNRTATYALRRGGCSTISTTFLLGQKKAP